MRGTPKDIFWRRWLALGAAYGVLAGTGIIALALLPAECGLTAFFRAVFMFHVDGPGGVTAASRLATAVTGALTAGLSVIAWSLRPDPSTPRASDQRAGKALAAGVLTWFVLDSAASVALGGAVNVIGNLTFLIALLPPSLAMASRQA